MRSRRMLLTVALLAGLAMPVNPAYAQENPLAIADQPAATLLLPYFEVDLVNPAGANMQFTVNNASGSAVLAHVTLWSTMHVPVHAFDIYLTGYDAQPINVRDLLNGNQPKTASLGQDPLDAISPQGPFSQDINYASCTGQLPPALLPQATIDHIRAALTGVGSPLVGGMCASKSDGTQIARGYITVDTVNACSSLLPNTPGYFGATVTNQNVLWGDYASTNHLRGREDSTGGPLVHIKASSTDPDTSTPGEYTFYGRLVNWTAIDNREPLASTFWARFASGGVFTRTTLTVWRDPKVNQNYFACGTNPSWFPLSEEDIVFFDEQENPDTVFNLGNPFSPPIPGSFFVTPFAFGTQRVEVGGPLLPTTFAFGAIFLNLNTTIAAGGPPSDFAAAQAWVSVQMKGAASYSVGWPALQHSSARLPAHFVIIP